MGVGRTLGTYDIDDFSLFPVLLYDCIVLAFLIALVFA